MIERFRRCLARRRAIRRQVDATLRATQFQTFKLTTLQTALIVKRRLREQGFDISTDEAGRWIIRRRWIR